MTYKFKHFQIPEHMEDGITRYIEKGILTGDFLRAVLSNSLRGAVDHADDINIYNIPAYIGYFYNNIPGICWGSSEKVSNWMARSQEERDEILSIGDYKPLREFG